MAKKEPEAQESVEVSEPLTPEQRIGVLEKSLKTNRIILLVTVLMLLLSLGTSIAALVLESAEPASVEQQQNAVAAEPANGKRLEERVNIMLTSFDERLAALQTAQDNESLIKLFALQTELEQDKQRFALGARSAIGDLARMVPGSRTWLEMYSEQIDQGLKRSKERVNAIHAIKSGLRDANDSQPGD